MVDADSGRPSAQGASSVDFEFELLRATARVSVSALTLPWETGFAALVLMPQKVLPAGLSSEILVRTPGPVPPMTELVVAEPSAKKSRKLEDLIEGPAFLHAD